MYAFSIRAPKMVLLFVIYALLIFYLVCYVGIQVMHIFFCNLYISISVSKYISIHSKNLFKNSLSTTPPPQRPTHTHINIDANFHFEFI